MVPPLAADVEAPVHRRASPASELLAASAASLHRHTRLASSLTGWPLALLSASDGRRQWFRSTHGLSVPEARTGYQAFCALVAEAPHLLEIEDSRLDPRLAPTPLVAAAPFVVACAGLALRLPNGQCIGTLCVMDTQPRRLSAHEHHALKTLADDLVLELVQREEADKEADEESLIHREAEKRLRAMAQVLPTMVWSVLPEGRTEFCNRRWYQFTGLPEVNTPDNDEWHDLVHPDDLGPVLTAWSQARACGTEYEAEFRLRNHQGDYRWVLDRAAPHVGPDGRLVRWLGTTTDVHELRLSREESHRKDEFLAMLAHELRNPLAPIGYATAILKGRPDDHSRVSTFVDVIDRQVRHMTTLIDDLLDVSRVTRGVIQLENLPVDLGEVLHRALEQVQPLIAERHHRVQQALPDTALWVRGDAVRLTQVIANLVNNAAKYTPQEGLIRISLAVQDGLACLEVRDNGQGIEKSLLNRVLDLFTQGRRTPDRAQGGLGLGLSLVKSLVQLHGGTVTAHSEGPGRGSAFAVSLPLAGHSHLPMIDRPHGKTPSGRSLKVMVVDDNEAAAHAVGQLLAFEGHDVRVFTESPQALAAALADPAEAYILDIGLPVMDGYELARRLKRHEDTAHAMLIALTGYGQSHDKTLALEAGFDHHLVKPGDPVVLQRLLMEAGQRVRSQA